MIPFLFSSLDSTKRLQKIGLNVKLTSDVFHWEDLVGNNSDNKNNPKQNSASGDYSIPQMFYLLVGTIEGTIREFSYDRFKASSIHGKIIFILNQIYFNDLSMKAEGGTITANGKLNIESPSNSRLELVANLNQLNISQLFFEFNNFGQQMITDKILSGNLTASISLQSIWDDKKLNKEKLHAIADITIEDGELNNFEPMLALSKFIKVNELKDIRFSKMQNQLEVTHQQVIIPSMQIFTNAMNLTLSGTHGFNNIIDYKVQLNLLRLLTDKFRKTNFDPGVTEQTTEGFLNLFLTMKGDASNPVIKYDKQSVKQKINADLAIEKTTLKETLKREFKKQESIQQQEEKEAIDQNQIQFFQFEDDSTNNKNE